MNEAVFPVLGAAFVLLVLLPLCALGAKAALLLLERAAFGGPLRASNRRYLIITGSSLLPLAWFLSAGLHQLESGKSALACLFDHAGAAHCLEPGAFSLALGLSFAATTLPVIRRHRRSGPRPSADGAALLARLQRIIEQRSALEGLRDRIVVTDTPGFALGAAGWARPQVFVGSGFAARVPDDVLASALGHELEHLRSLDPLRYFVLELALAANPLGRTFLTSHAARWSAAHEAHCDREAVLRGFHPLVLAEAIVCAARPSLATAPLGAPDTAVLELRVGLLLAFSERAPEARRSSTRPAFPLACALLGLALVLPHQAGTAALDVLHTGTELALGLFAL